MCCDGWDYGDAAIVGECPTCGEDIDCDGDAVRGCNYSPVVCEVCGSRPCDGSC